MVVLNLKCLEIFRDKKYYREFIFIVSEIHFINPKMKFNLVRFNEIFTWKILSFRALICLVSSSENMTLYAYDSKRSFKTLKRIEI